MFRLGRMPAILAACALVVAACGDSESQATSGPESPSTEAAGETTPPSTPAPTPTPTPDPKPRDFSVAATGDVLLHERLWTQAKRDADSDGTWNFAPQLANIEPVVSESDLAICHLEVPIAPEDGPFEGYPRFSGPPQIVPALAETGYDACTTASNHVFDQGADGVQRTLDTLEEHGLAHAGSARTKEESQEQTIISVETPEGSVNVGLISYTFGFNGIPYPNGEEWRSNRIDEEDILDDAAAARDAGAEVVIVALHWGDEYVHDPNRQQRELAPRLIASDDVDALLGHHAHVVQPMEEFDGQWVVYGLGNLMANHARPESPLSEGLLARLTFTEDVTDGSFSTTAAEYLPLYQTYELPVEVLHVPAALATGESGTASESRLEEALDRTTSIVEDRGGADAGLEMIEAE
ncbi:CapA family protein [Actinobacteria bacterium YIM 96077]|uniref:CapA family protein n=1 Tax=Phytoactinopolyspora halophila TaxID=1981511 RepID=A0A329QWU1_9ACTN|nr:CapA family protein [Phytoactinopolyspora halophila]AYY12771.1 CapA family protein [Actinobacteria bacterium YIM 96077]RAW16436.1 CapA family protein [Phytoactinopolyspora halophila]